MRHAAKLFSITLLLLIICFFFNSLSISTSIISQLRSLNQLYLYKFNQKLKSRIAPQIDKSFAYSTNAVEAPSAEIIPPGGIFENSVLIKISPPDDNTIIQYTLDGSIPTKNSLIYKSKLSIKKTTALRYRTFKTGFLPGEVKTQTYIINKKINLPIFSLVTDPVNLWNRHSGIYKQYKKKGGKWLRNCSVEIFGANNRSSLFKFPAKIGIHGGWSRRRPKKSFKLFFNTLELDGTHALTNFSNTLDVDPKDMVNVLVLRAGGNNYKHRTRNELFQLIYSELGGISTPSRPCVVYLNGKYWGIYNKYKNVDKSFLEKKLGNDEYDLISNQNSIFSNDMKIIEGDLKFFKEAIHFIENHDLSENKFYNTAQHYFNAEDLADYWLSNIYAANADWPHNNTLIFRKKNNPPSNFRWISWDADFIFDIKGKGLHHNTIAWAIRPAIRNDIYNPLGSDSEEMVASTFIIRNFLKNAAFKNYFLTRFCDLLNTYFSYKNIILKLEDLRSITAEDLTDDLDRWAISKEAVLTNIQQIKHFAQHRPDVLLEYFKNSFEIDNIHTFTLNVHPENSVTVTINNIPITQFPWQGKYFQDAILHISIIPNPNYCFNSWSIPQKLNLNNFQLRLDKDYILDAFFDHNPPQKEYIEHEKN